MILFTIIVLCVVLFTSIMILIAFCRVLWKLPDVLYALERLFDRMYLGD